MKILLFLSALVYAAESACKEGELTELEQAVLDAHNELRKNHEGTEPLCYAESGDDVTFISQQWADSMAETAKGYMDMHHSTGEYGENLAYAGSSGDRPGQKESYIRASKSWYSEIEDWNFKTHQSNGGVTGHFTQLVWKESKQLNCGYAEFITDKSYNAYFVVCQYFPRGNFGGTDDFALQVGQPADGADLSEYNIGGDGGDGDDGSNATALFSSTVFALVATIFFLLY